MHTFATIKPIDAGLSIYVLRDAQGGSLGTGPKEALEVLRYIVEQTNRPAYQPDFSPSAFRAYGSADVRSALVF